MSPGLRFSLLLWHAGAVGALTALPFVAVVLADLGLQPGSIAVVLLLLPVGQLVAAPLWTWAADRTNATTVLRITSVGATLASMGVAAAPSPTTMGLAVFALAITRAGASPTGDALTVTLLGPNRRTYGQIRAIGSLVFALVIFVDGYLRMTWPRGPLWIGAGLMGLATVAAFTLPATRSAAQRPSLADLKQIFRHPLLAPLLAVTMLHGVTLTTYDHLFTLHIEAHGHAPSVAGAAFATGVLVEVAVLLLGRRILDRVGPMPLLVLSIASAAPRWLITGQADSPAVLIATQSLHGISFGGFWVACIALFSERAPAGLGATSQGLFTAATFGAGYLVAMSVAAVVLRITDTGALFTGMAATSAVAAVWTLVLWTRHR